MKRVSLPLLLILASTGCVHRLPAIRAEEIHSNTAVLGVAVSADAMGVHTTPLTMKADDVQWKVSFPGFSHVTSAKGYEQRLPREETTK